MNAYSAEGHPGRNLDQCTQSMEGNYPTNTTSPESPVPGALALDKFTQTADTSQTQSKGRLHVNISVVSPGNSYI